MLEIVIEDNRPQFEILGHNGNTLLEGDDVNNILVDFCIKKFYYQYKINIDTLNKENIIARKRLKDACERTKKNLSYQNKTKINIESLFKDKDFQLEIIRPKFEDLCKKKFEEIIKLIQVVLTISNLKKEDIDEILLVGGSTRIPKIEEILKEFFEKNKNIINKSINPDEVVAYGTTL